MAAITGASQHLTQVKVGFLAEMFAGIMSVLLEKRELLIKWAKENDTERTKDRTITKVRSFLVCA
jgi:hypothetical protein